MIGWRPFSLALLGDEPAQWLVRGRLVVATPQGIAGAALGGQLQGNFPRDGVSMATLRTPGTAVYGAAGLDGLGTAVQLEPAGTPRATSAAFENR